MSVATPASGITVFLMGLRGSGKSSICQVVLQGVAPEDTDYLQSTSSVTQYTYQSWNQINFMEVPGQADLLDGNFDARALFPSARGLIYVIDVNSEYSVSIDILANLILAALETDPDFVIDILLHKKDQSQDYIDEINNDVQYRLDEKFYELGVPVGTENHIYFHNTSIYDNSIHEAMSDVIRFLTPERDAMEGLLDSMVEMCHVDCAYLIDIRTKVVVARGTLSMDTDVVELCAHFVDIAVDMDSMYDSPEMRVRRKQEAIEWLENQNADTSTISRRSAVNLYMPDVSRPLRCVSKFGSGGLIYLNEMLNDVALICLADAVSTDNTAIISVIDHNAAILKKGLETIRDTAFDDH